MSKIKIKNFGPIGEGYQENDGYMDVKKVTVFIGNQGSGKSVVAKLISTFSWIEKAITRGDYNISHFEKAFSKKDQGKNQYFTYHRLENYFPATKETIIDYKGESYHFSFKRENHLKKGKLIIKDAKNGDYPLPQIMYVSADRNFISNVRTPKALKQISPSLSELITEMINAGLNLKAPILLPVNEETYVEYNRQYDIFYIKGSDYRIKLTEASSGYQSLIPLFLTSWFLSDSVKKQSGNEREIMSSEQRERFRRRFKAINDNPDLTDELRRIALSELAKEFTKTAFVNIVEEPEQNLFPKSQQGMLYSLLEFNNLSKGNKLIMTTHSPYLINYLTLAIKAEMIKTKITSEGKEELDKKVPLKSTVKAGNLVIYELNEKKGIIMKLGDYKGLPSDENYLNADLEYSNELFAQLQEIEKGWR